MRTKYLDIVATIERRLSGGDYALNDIPGERRLATEFGVSHMTARKAVQHLLKTGVLKRPEKGIRIAQPRKSQKPQLVIGLVIPAFESIGIHTFYRILSDLVGKEGGLVRPVPYAHDEDPAIGDALRGDFTGLFLLPPHKPGELLLDQMKRERGRVVTLWHDFTSYGIPCVEHGPPRCMARAVEYLVSLGHRAVDCINAEPENNVIRQRVQVWRDTIARLGVGGEFINNPVASFSHPSVQAYKTSLERFKSGRKFATAAVCVTTATALGVMRAAHDAGIRVGRDISVIGWSDIELASIYTPSLTVVQPPDLQPYVARGLEWIQSGGKMKVNDLHFESASASLWIGESTGAPVSA